MKAAQERIAKREGGIIWHTQGSGKSLTMVWLAKWIREHQDDARVLLITDRTELDEQIEKVFNGVNEQIYRTSSGADLLDTLNKSQEWLICSLVHKFRGSDDDKALDEAERGLHRGAQRQDPDDFKAKGNLFVFVDEAHRTQSGKMHAAMKQLLPEAMFIGFTGTPLLKADKATSIETFGSFIHTYKFDEAVKDGVVLDLRYEARNIDQNLTSPAQVDKWFEVKTKGMTDLSKAELKKRWGTMQKVVSSEPRAKQIVNDILLDMETKPRLMDGRGNAMLVGSASTRPASSTSCSATRASRASAPSSPATSRNAGDISKEDSGEGKTEKLRQYDIYRKMLADHFDESEDAAMRRSSSSRRRSRSSSSRTRPDAAADRGRQAPDRLRRSERHLPLHRQEDARPRPVPGHLPRQPSRRRRQGLRLHRRLPGPLQLPRRRHHRLHLRRARRLREEGHRRPAVRSHREGTRGSGRGAGDGPRLCEPVAPPKNTLQYQQYFCAMEQGNAEQLKANEPKRVELYKAVAAVTRAFANIANEMGQPDTATPKPRPSRRRSPTTSMSEPR